jgi:hypothetical protein
VACNPDCQRECCNGSARVCGCEVYEICTVCDPERYKYQVAMRGLEGVQSLMGDQHKVSVGPVKTHLLRPEHHRFTWCGIDSVLFDECVTRNPEIVTCKHCKRRHAPWYWKLTYIFRLLAVPLAVLGLVGAYCTEISEWVARHTWAPLRKRKSPHDPGSVRRRFFQNLL